MLHPFGPCRVSPGLQSKGCSCRGNGRVHDWGFVDDAEVCYTTSISQRKLEPTVGIAADGGLLAAAWRLTTRAWLRCLQGVKRKQKERNVTRKSKGMGAINDSSCTWRPSGCQWIEWKEKNMCWWMEVVFMATTMDGPPGWCAGGRQWIAENTTCGVTAYQPWNPAPSANSVNTLPNFQSHLQHLIFWVNYLATHNQFPYL